MHRRWKLVGPQPRETGFDQHNKSGVRDIVICLAEVPLLQRLHCS